MLKELLTMQNHVEYGAYYLPKSGGYAHIGDLASESERAAAMQAADAEHEDRAERGKREYKGRAKRGGTDTWTRGNVAARARGLARSAHALFGDAFDAREPGLVPLAAGGRFAGIEATDEGGRRPRRYGLPYRRRCCQSAKMGVY